MHSTDRVAHTPGPWKVRAAHFCDDGTPAYEVEMHGDRTINAKDANLIAAAPDLLAACMRTLNWLSSYPGDGAKGAYEQVRAAIAKAEGRS